MANFDDIFNASQSVKTEDKSTWTEMPGLR